MLEDLPHFGGGRRLGRRRGRRPTGPRSRSPSRLKRPSSSIRLQSPRRTGEYSLIRRRPTCSCRGRTYCSHFRCRGPDVEFAEDVAEVFRLALQAVGNLVEDAFDLIGRPSFDDHHHLRRMFERRGVLLPMLVEFSLRVEQLGTVGLELEEKKRVARAGARGEDHQRHDESRPACRDAGQVRNVCATADMRGLPGLSCRVVVLRCIPANALTVVVAPGRKAVRHQMLGPPCECPDPTCAQGGPAHLFGAPRFL